MNVKFFKLKSGQEIIADVVSADKNGIIVNKPRGVELARDQNGGLVSNLIPYTFSNPGIEGFAISVDLLGSGLGDPEEDAAKHYEQSVTPVALIQKPGIIT